MTTAEREELILSLAPRVRGAVDRIFRAMRTPVEREDMLSEAWIGAIQAVDRFDPKRGLKLGTLAERRIRGQILDYLRRVDKLKRKHRQQIKTGQADAPRTVAIGELDFKDQRAEGAIRRLEARSDARGILCRAKLKPRIRRILNRHYRDEALDSDVGREFGVTPSRISQLRNLALQKLRAAV
jgi:RNA polymerase sigma factor (sigma-70 family)